MGAGRHGKDVIQLLESALFGLGYKEEDQHQSGDVERGVKAEGTNGMESAEKSRESDGEHGGPEEASSDGPTHANLAVG